MTSHPSRAALLLSCVAACSYLTVTPPAAPPQPAGDCTTSFAAPGIDLLVTIAAGAVTLLAAALVIQSGNGCTGNDCGVAGGVGIVVGVPAAAVTIGYGFSTGYGHRTVDRCVRLRATQRAKRGDRSTARQRHQVTTLDFRLSTVDHTVLPE